MMRLNIEVEDETYIKFRQLCEELGGTTEYGFRKIVAYYVYVMEKKSQSAMLLVKESSGELREIFER